MFGLSFGAKKSSSSGTSLIDKLEEGFQKGLETTTGTKTGTSTTSGTGTSSSTGLSTTTQDTNNTTKSSGSQQTSGRTEALDEQTRSGLGNAITSLLTNIFSGETGDRKMILAGLDRMGGFDPEAYVSGTLSRAAATQGSQLDEILGSIFSRVGGSEGNNSASSLLAGRARNDAASNLAGIEAQARATAQNIMQGNTKTTADALNTAGGAQLLPALANILKGAVTTEDQTTLMQQLEELIGKQTGTTQTQESAQTSQQQTTTSVEALAQQVAQLLEQSMHTTGTEKTTTKGKEMGGGFSLSL